MALEWFGKIRAAFRRLAGYREKGASTQVVLFIPSVDRDSNAINQRLWIRGALNWLGMAFGGATAFPRGLGVWRDDARGGHLVFDRTVVIFCYTTDEELRRNEDNLRDFLIQMGRETNQGAVAFAIDQVFIEISMDDNP